MKSRTFVDQIDAEMAAKDFIDSIQTDRSSVFDRVDQHLDGRLTLLWRGFTLIGQATIVRDDGNRSILTCIDLRENLTHD